MAPTAAAAAANGARLMTWAVGPGLIVLQCFLQLAPKFIVSNALLVEGRGAEELVFRRAMAESMLLVMAVDMAWNALRPRGVSQHVAGLLLLVGTLVTALNTVLAYQQHVEVDSGDGEDHTDIMGWGADSDSSSGYLSLKYTPTLAFSLQAASGLLTIPVNQHTSLWRLGESKSPVRWRVVGWIVTVSLGTVALVVPPPFATSVVPTVLMRTAFPLFVGASLVIKRNHTWDPSTPEGEAATRAAAKRKKSSELFVSIWPTALHYFVLSIACGTHAEAINDMATGLCVRAAQLSGESKLALTNNISVLLAQLLALGSETGLSKWASNDERKRALGFLTLWSVSQLLRGFGMSLIEQGGATGSTALAVFVFIDKYTGFVLVRCLCLQCACVNPCSTRFGEAEVYRRVCPTLLRCRPLGSAALDIASVSLLQATAISVKEVVAEEKSEPATKPGVTAKKAKDSGDVVKSAGAAQTAQRRLSWTAPAALLLSMHAATSKFERPFWEFILLSQTHWQWQWVRFQWVNATHSLLALTSTFAVCSYAQVVTGFVVVGAAASTHALFTYLPAARVGIDDLVGSGDATVPKLPKVGQSAKPQRPTKTGAINDDQMQHLKK